MKGKFGFKNRVIYCGSPYFVTKVSETLSKDIILCKAIKIALEKAVGGIGNQFFLEQEIQTNTHINIHRDALPIQ